VADGGLDVAPETSWNSELGIRSRAGRSHIEGTVFYLAIEDMVAAARGTVFENLGRVDTYGIELGGLWATSDWHPALADLELSYTYLQTEVKRGRIPSAVQTGVVVDIGAALVKRFTDQLELRFGVKHVSAVFTDFENIEYTANRGDTGPVPSYTILDASGAWHLSERSRVFVAAKNLTDRVYIGSRLHSHPGSPDANASSGILVGARRQVNMGISFDY
jgi:Fe(3+) dicitrate transport protein